MKILICLASKQAAANLNSLREVRADKVLVAVTQDMQSEGENLIQQIKQEGISGEKFELLHESSLAALNQQFEELIEQYIDDELVINVTGGTKLMSIAAYQVFNGYGFRCFYQHLKPNQLVWLDDESTISDIGTKIGLERYLKSYHFEIIKKKTLADFEKQYIKYTEILYAEVCKPGKFTSVCSLISKLNAHAAKPAIQDLKKLILSQDEEAFLSHLSRETNLFKLTSTGISWDTEEDRAFIAGGWFEILVADLINGKSFRDLSISVEIAKSTQRAKAKTVQEIDVMAMQQQKLVIVECKTANWKNTTDASEAIYKLSALSDLGGLNTRAIFVSLYDLPDAAKTRAAEHDIQVIAGQAAILQLKQRLVLISNK